MRYKSKKTQEVCLAHRAFTVIDRDTVEPGPWVVITNRGPQTVNAARFEQEWEEAGLEEHERVERFNEAAEALRESLEAYAKPD